MSRVKPDPFAELSDAHRESFDDISIRFQPYVSGTGYGLRVVGSQVFACSTMTAAVGYCFAAPINATDLFSGHPAVPPHRSHRQTLVSEV
ncbi:hypothetical protein [Kribbella sp. NPDC050470]|uniref:hypothetical protein n=1 Tax=unclassified Kribbella TaxID=2644121 RepID=UPI003787D416